MIPYSGPFGAISLIVGLAAGNKGTGLLKAPSWRWTVSGVVVLGVAAYQHFTCPRGGAGAAPLGATAAPPHSPSSSSSLRSCRGYCDKL